MLPEYCSGGCWPCSSIEDWASLSVFMLLVITKLTSTFKQLKTNSYLLELQIYVKTAAKFQQHSCMVNDLRFPFSYLCISAYSTLLASFFFFISLFPDNFTMLQFLRQIPMWNREKKVSGWKQLHSLCIKVHDKIMNTWITLRHLCLIKELGHMDILTITNFWGFARTNEPCTHLVIFYGLVFLGMLWVMY